MREPRSVEATAPHVQVDWWARNQGWVLYPLAVVTYAALGLLWKPLLNWIIGPVWVLVVVWLFPALVVRVIARFR